MRFLVLARARARGLLSDERSVVAKSRRLSRIRAAMDGLQARVKRDLRSSDPDRFLTALAVGLMVETSEDLVTDWRKRNVEIEDRTAVFRTKGRKKNIANDALVLALADAYEAVEDGDEELFAHDMGRVTPDRVAEYLGRFKLSMKDIRGFNAGRLMESRLEGVRAKGPELPRHKRSRTKLLQAEFLEALNGVSNEVGLEADMIRHNYLDPGLEASYLSQTPGKKAYLDPLSFGVAFRYRKLHG